MALTIHRFDPSDCHFPKPRLPMWPAWHRQTFKRLRWRPAMQHSEATAGTPRSRGRYALYAGLKALGLGPGSLFLAPEYHCRSMLDPAIALGAQVRFYGLNDHLQPDLQSVGRLLQSTPRDSRSAAVNTLLVAHFFGIEALLQDLCDLCRSEGLTVVEDCAHCLVDAQGRLPAILQTGGAESRIGACGDIVVASPYKFLPLGEGGMVWVRGPGLSVEPGHRAPISRELHASTRLVCGALQAAVRPPSQPVRAHDLRSLCGRDVVERDGGTYSTNFDPAQTGDRGVAFARWMAGGWDLHVVARRRRQRFAQWLQACRPWQSLGLCQPLHSTLPGAAVPYMFALHVVHGAQVFFQLRSQGVPAGRWDDTASAPGDPPCPRRLNLLHLPVHQEIEDDAMNWMLRVFESAMGSLRATAA